MNGFALAYREQQQLFLFDKTYLGATLFKVGGFATLLSQFIVQFFRNPTVAVILSLCLLALMAWLLWFSVRRTRADWAILPLCLIPAILGGASLSDHAFHFDALVSAILALTALACYSRIRRGRLLWGLILTVGLYALAGPASLLFAVCAMILDLAGEGRKGWPSLIYPVLAVGCGCIAVLTAAVPTWSAALTPSFWYDLDAKMPSCHLWVWLSVPVIVLLAVLARKTDIHKLYLLAGCTILAALAIIPAHRISSYLESKEPLKTYEFEYYVAREDWDGLIKACEHSQWLPRTANYLNLALSRKGELAERLLDYDQRGPDALVLLTKDRAVDIAQVHLMMAMGNVAAAQDVAFNTLSSLSGYCPLMMEVNAQVDLMRGSYEVADKYLSLLEKTLYYRRWAKEHRRFLYDDDAVEADPLLGNGRRNLTAENAFVMYSNPMSELFPILDANPANKQVLEYGLCYLLLSKDLNSVKHFIEDYYSSPDSPELPRIAQEAMVFYSEFSRNMEGTEPFGLDWCYAHGVKQEVVDRFLEYQKAAVIGPESLKRYRGTYWYYLVHTKV